MQRLKQLCLSIPVLALASLVAASMPAAAHADTFDFTITSTTTNSGGDVVPTVFTGVFTTTDTTNSSGYYTVTSISDGMVNGTPETLTLLAPGTYGSNDNFVSLTSPFDDTQGIGFTDGTDDYDLYTTSATAGPELLCQSSVESFCHFDQGSAATVTVTDATNVAATPEPSSLVLLGTGALGLAGVLRRKATALLS